MARQQYTDDERVAALAQLAANGGNLKRTARALGLPAPTLRLWRDTVLPHALPLPPLPSPTVPAPSAPSAPPCPPSLATRAAAAEPPTEEDRASLGERVGREIAHIAFGNLSDIVSWDGDGRVWLTPSADLSPAQAALIGEIRVKRRRERGTAGEDGEPPSWWEVEDIQIKTRDKLGALRLLAEITGIRPVAGGVSVAVDARQQSIALPEGLSLEELRQLAQLAPGGGEQ